MTNSSSPTAACAIPKRYRLRVRRYRSVAYQPSGSVMAMRNGLGACAAKKSSAAKEDAARLENAASRRFRK